MCSVDVLNEGVDVPAVDRVLMLRPTESPVVFLQQLGRGLRRAEEGKEALTVIDFVGNHRLFAERLRQVLSLASPEAAWTVGQLVTEAERLELPHGCSVEIELEAKDILQKLLRVRGGHALERYRAFRDERGRRPTAGELFRLGVNPRAVRDGGGQPSWFELARAEGDLSPAEAEAEELLRPFLVEVETTAMTKSFKMVVLEALIEADALYDGLEVGELARWSHRVARRSPELRTDVQPEFRFDRLDSENEGEWLRYWRKNPVSAWTGEMSKNGRGWFALDGSWLRPTFEAPVAPEVRAAGTRLVRELVDYRLAQYRRRNPGELGASFTCKLITNQRHPILKLPDRSLRADPPEGEIDVRLPTGAMWSFRFAQASCDVARPVGTGENQLPDLLRGWFGPEAGGRGTVHQVRFSPSPEGWWVEPLIEARSRETRCILRFYPELSAAAGEGDAAATAEVVLPLPEEVAKEVRSRELFAVRTTITDEGEDALLDGDWLVMAPLRDGSLSEALGRLVLMEVASAEGADRFQVGRLTLREDGRGFYLATNPPLRIAEEVDTPLAVERAVIRPEELAPPAGTLIPDGEVDAAFGIDDLRRLPEPGQEPERSSTPGTGLKVSQSEPRPSASGRGPGSRACRAGGHLFLFVEAPGALACVDRLQVVVDRSPGETAFILARPSVEKPWRYCGVGRFYPDENLWSVPDLDFPTAKALGVGRHTSRTLPKGALDRAKARIRKILERHPPGAEGGSWVEAAGRRCRILGPSPSGGLRIDGGDEGFKERTISPIDIAWCLVAQDHAEAHGAPLDEARVHRVRYAEGTPKSSTRYIDTQWALLLLLSVGEP